MTVRNNLARYLYTDHVRPKKQRRSYLRIWWQWCHETAATGWMVVLVVTMILFVLFASRLEEQTGEVLRQCIWQ